MLEVSVFEKVGSSHDSTQDAWASSSNLIVLADGVGSWSNIGIDSALWSHLMVWEVSSCVTEQPGAPLDAIRRALARCRLPGSSTLSLIEVFDGRGMAYNIGDSFWLHIRDGRIIGRSQDTVHGFGRPRQLGRAMDGSLHGDDIPEDGTLDELQLEDGDILIVASDGIRGIIDMRSLAETVSFSDLNASTEILDSLVHDLILVNEMTEYDDITVVVAIYRDQ